MGEKNLNAQVVTKIEDFLKQLNKEELVFLNRMVVERVKLMNQLETTSSMIRFNIGDRVTFTTRYGETFKGQIIRMNKKTISILTDTNVQWNVHPSLLKHL